MVNRDEVDPTFVEDLGDSRRLEALVIQYYQEIKGRPVFVPPRFVRPSADDRAGYSDWGDLYIGHRLELRWRKLDFIDAASYEYPTIDVEIVGVFENKRPPPDFYLISNRAMTYALLLDCFDESRKQWTKRSHKSKGRDRISWTAPKDLVRKIIRLPSVT